MHIQCLNFNDFLLVFPYWYSEKSFEEINSLLPDITLKQIYYETLSIYLSKFSINWETFTLNTLFLILFGRILSTFRLNGTCLLIHLKTQKILAFKKVLSRISDRSVWNISRLWLGVLRFHVVSYHTDNTFTTDQVFSLTF